jgi:hypothetical protein
MNDRVSLDEVERGGVLIRQSSAMSGGRFVSFPKQSYESQAQALFTQYGRDVVQFTKGCERLVQEGEKRLRYC